MARMLNRWRPRLPFPAVEGLKTGGEEQQRLIPQTTTFVISIIRMISLIVCSAENTCQLGYHAATDMGMTCAHGRFHLSSFSGDGGMQGMPVSAWQGGPYR